MFLFITEDQRVLVGNVCGNDDLEAIDNGLLSIVDISDPEKPMEYYAGGWSEVPLYAQREC